VFTISDRGYKPFLLVTVLLWLPVEGAELWALLIITPFVLSSTRIGRVTSYRKMRRIHKFLITQFRPSFRSFLSNGQAMNVKCSDRWWKHCVLALMHTSEIIVVDLSIVKSGTDWEIRELFVRHLLPKTLFVVSDAHKDSTADTLSRYFRSGEAPPVHVYNAKGEIYADSGFHSQLNSLVTLSLSNQEKLISSAITYVDQKA
jgi:hypothetical protein